jgi:VanZ family protein
LGVAADRRRRAWILTIAYVAVIFAVSSIPGSVHLVPPFRLSDKLAHVAEYSGLGLLLTAAYRATLPKGRSRWILPCVLGTGLVAGALDELYQTTVPGRSVELLDWVADVVGIVLGNRVWSMLHRRRMARRPQEG